MTLHTKREDEIVKIARQLGDLLVQTTCGFMAKQSLTRTESASIPLAAIGNLVALCAAGFAGDPEDWLDQFKANLDHTAVRAYMAQVRRNFMDAKQESENQKSNGVKNERPS